MAGATNAAWELLRPQPRSHSGWCSSEILNVRVSHRPNPAWDPPVEGAGGGVWTGFREEDSTPDKDGSETARPFSAANRCGSMDSKYQSIAAPASLHPQEASSAGASNRN